MSNGKKGKQDNNGNNDNHKALWFAADDESKSNAASKDGRLRAALFGNQQQ